MKLNFTRPFFAGVFSFLVSAAWCAAFTTNDADQFFSLYNNAFYVQEGGRGFFKDSQTNSRPAYFWTQAETIETVIDAYEWTGNETAKSMITNLLNGFIDKHGVSWGRNPYNDDIMWAVLAFVRGGSDTGSRRYCDIARSNYDTCYGRAYDKTYGGGLWWTVTNQSKNACINGPAAIAACLMHQTFGDAKYLAQARSIYAWEKAKLFFEDGGIADAYRDYEAVGDSTTYNQGTFIGAANFLGFTNDAALAAHYTMTEMCRGGILPRYESGGNNSGFNAIYLRWLMRYINDRHLRPQYESWLQTNANAAWNVRRADGLSWCRWRRPTPVGMDLCSWDCISSVSAIFAAAAGPTANNAAQSPAATGGRVLDAGSHGKTSSGSINFTNREQGTPP